VLEPLKSRGAAVGSLHPFQTVASPAEGVKALKGCYWGIEGDREARRIAAEWAKKLGGVVTYIRPGQKILYHAAAFLVSPTLVTLMDQSIRLLRHSGFPPNRARKMLSQFAALTVQNFAALGARRALTGPASRGDWTTIKAHLAAFERTFPDVIPIYIPLLRAMLRLAGRRPPRSLSILLQK